MRNIDKIIYETKKSVQDLITKVMEENDLSVPEGLLILLGIAKDNIAAFLFLCKTALPPKAQHETKEKFAKDIKEYIENFDSVINNYNKKTK